MRLAACNFGGFKRPAEDAQNEGWHERHDPLMQLIGRAPDFSRFYRGAAMAGHRPPGAGPATDTISRYSAAELCRRTAPVWTNSVAARIVSGA